MTNADSPSRIDALLEEAMAVHQQGALEQAEDGYRSILALAPNHFAATQLLGVIRNQCGDFEGAVCFLKEALRLNPRSAMAHFNLGLALWNLRKLMDALVHFHQALAIHPTNAEALLNRGLVLEELNQPTDALRDFDRVLTLQPDQPLALLHRGIALLELEYFEDAIATFERVSSIEPNQVDALIYLATALRRSQRDEEALVCLDQVLLLRADFPEIHLDRGLILLSLDRAEAALVAFDKVLTLQIDHLDALLNRGRALRLLHRLSEAQAAHERALAVCDRILAGQADDLELLLKRGNALMGLDRPDEALISYDQALGLQPGHVDLLVNRGAALMKLKRPKDALAAFDLALDQQPDQAAVLLNHGNALMELGQLEAALASFDHSLVHRPRHLETLNSRARALHFLARHEEAYAAYDRVLALQPTNAIALSSKIFVLDYLSDPEFREHQAVRRTFVQSQAIGLQAPTAHNNDRTPSRRLRLGYVSADFRHHSAAFCFGPVLARHDHAAFEVVCYSGVEAEDASTAKFRANADLWRPTTNLSDDDLEAQIRADGIDILIDLAGHSQGNRLPVFARKPAPIQVTAWGGAGGTGLPMIDYHFTDPVHIPNSARPLFTETAYDLPCVITYEAPALAPPLSTPPALAKGFVTFGNLNRFLKITQANLELWARILHGLPGSRLLLKDRPFEDAHVRARVHAAFAKLDIGSERLSLRGFTNQLDHLATYQDVDIALDTYPQNGGITTWESLWMGVPVIAMLGNKPPSRLSGAILQALDMGEWVAEDESKYLKLALQRAANLKALVQFRKESRDRILASPAGNPDRYAQAVEAAYRAMWTNWVSL